MGVVVVEDDPVDVDLGCPGLDALAHQLGQKAVGAMESNMCPLVELCLDQIEPENQ